MPSGVPGFDEITGGGLPKGCPTLVAGSAGSGKTLFSMEFLIRGALDHGEPGVYMSFEENAVELAQNVASLGFDLADLSARKKILVDHVRVERSEIEETGEYDLEGLFVRLSHAIDSIGARRVVLDTVESLFGGFQNEGILRSELKRLFRWLKERESLQLSRGSGGKKRSPATAWRNTWPTASSSSTTALRRRYPPGAFAWSSTAALLMVPTSTHS
jgi:circadian clock protein KaiC